MEVPEAYLVVNEKIPAPRFNFVQDVRCSPRRVTAFLERTLDHYYARALRPTFQLRAGETSPEVAKALGLAQYLPLGAERRRHVLLWDPGTGASKLPPPGVEAPPQPLDAEEFGAFADQLVLPRQRQEIVRCLEVAEAHPNPGERTVAYLSRGESGPVSSALYARQGSHAGLFAVGTTPDARSRGKASELVAAVLRQEALRDDLPVVLSAEGARPPAPLLRMGFELLQSFDVFALSPEGEKEGF